MTTQAYPNITLLNSLAFNANSITTQANTVLILGNCTGALELAEHLAKQDKTVHLVMSQAPLNQAVPSIVSHWIWEKLSALGVNQYIDQTWVQANPCEGKNGVQAVLKYQTLTLNADEAYCFEALEYSHPLNFELQSGCAPLVVKTTAQAVGVWEMKNVGEDLVGTQHTAQGGLAGVILTGEQVGNLAHYSLG